nr:hypothetical protein [Tanacetum cinerariifolium]
MSTLKFAEVHNMATFMSKPTESEGFEQIIDFLNAHSIKYALTVNLTIYTLCIEPFWATAKVKNINGEAQLHANVDGKKVVNFKASIRRDLQFGDEGRVDCLPNEVIFEQLTFMSTIASTVIYLATYQKFNFLKYIFESMVKNLDSVTKFLMYPRVVQVFLNNQLEEMENHTRIYVPPCHTKKNFRNMKRVGKGFSRRVTPLFPTMMVQAQKEMGEGTYISTDPQHTPTIIQPSTSQPLRKQKPRKTKRKDTQVPQLSMPTESVADEAVNEEMDNRLVRAATITSRLEVEQASGNIAKTQSKATPNESSSQGVDSGGGLRRQDTMGDVVTQTKSERVSKISNDPLLVGVNIPRSREDHLKLNELMDLCTNLLNRVLALEAIKTTQAHDIDSLNRRVKKLKKKQRSRTHKLIRLYKVVLSARVESFDDEGLGEEDASKQGRIIDDLDADEDITLVNDQEMSDADKDLQGEEVVVEQEVVADKEPIVDDAQAKVDKLAERLQAEEQQELNEEEKAKLFMELLEKRRKLFDTKRAEEKRNRPPIKA